MDEISRQDEPKHCNILVSFELRGISDDMSRMEFCLELLQDHEPGQKSRAHPNSGAGLTWQKAASSNAPTEEAWSCAKTWIEECTTSPTQCNALHDNTWHPARLLDVEGASHKVWLVETRKCSVSGPYATLSHRWPPDFRTTLILRSETYDLFRQGVAIVDLPQTVQDSITCCKNLSIRYLWVDCMCIIQNPKNPADWRKQASVMDKVYTHSHVNLSAVTADNTESSMFQPRDARSFNGMVTASIAQKLGFGEGRQRYRVINLSSWDESVTRSHINARAWVLQERILSPRILHFGFGQLFWECSMETATEEYPTGLPSFLKTIYKSLKNLDPAAQEDSPYTPDRAPHPDSDRGAYEIWSRIVDNYSQCGLTEPTDKLVALSGLAKRVSSIVDDEYVAGMWQRHLPAQLFWRVPYSEDRPESFDVERRSTRPVRYRAPSFSWAAIDEGIEFPPWSKHNLMAPEIVGAHLHDETEDVFGAITGGNLTVRSYLYRVLVLQSSTANSPGSKGFQLLRPDGYDNDGAPLESVIYWENRPLEAFDKDQDHLDFKDSVYGIPRSTEYADIFDLLILQLVNREEAHYARLGCTTIYDPDRDEPESLEDDLLIPPGDPSLHYPCIAYDGEKHTIRLV